MNEIQLPRIGISKPFCPYFLITSKNGWRFGVMAGFERYADTNDGYKFIHYRIGFMVMTPGVEVGAYPRINYWIRWKKPNPLA